jgi:hypothetical protein
MPKASVYADKCGWSSIWRNRVFGFNFARLRDFGQLSRATAALPTRNFSNNVAQLRNFPTRDFGSKFVRIQALVTPPYGIRVDQVRANSDIANTPVAAMPDKVRSECQNCSFCQHTGEKTPAW